MAADHDHNKILTEDEVSKIKLSIFHPGAFYYGDINPVMAASISNDLNQNHVERHCFFDSVVRIYQHNHTLDHQMTLFAMGSSPEHAHALFVQNDNYQKKQPISTPAIYQDMDDPKVYMKHLADQDQYGNFLHFFQGKIALDGVAKTLQRFLFARDEIANDLLCRLFMGLLHPIIRLGFGIEFNQPAVIAEGLAQAASHDDTYMIKTLLEVEKLAEARSDRFHLADIIDAVSSDEKVLIARDTPALDKMRFGVLKNSKEQMLEFASRYKVEPTDEDIELRAAELLNVSALIVGGAQRPGKLPRMDFLLLHIPNTAIFVSVMSKLPYLSNEDKSRLISFFGRACILVYAGWGAGPLLDLSVVRGLKPLAGGWDEACERGVAHPDDGHCVKLVRSLAYAAKESRSFDHLPQFRVKQQDFLQCVTGVIVSLNPAGGKAGMETKESWLRHVGLDSTWASVPDASTRPELWKESVVA